MEGAEDFTVTLVASNALVDDSDTRHGHDQRQRYSHCCPLPSPPAVSSESVVSGSHDVAVTLDIPGGGTLEHAVSVDVRNLGSGTADSGDFSFNTSPKTVTFPAGSSSGSQTVSITVLNGPAC